MSVEPQIWSAVRAQIAALSALSTYTVIEAERPTVDPEADTLPLCFVCPWKAEKPVVETFGAGLVIDYFLVVVLVLADNHAPRDISGITSVANARAAIRTSLWQGLPLAAVPSVMEAGYEPEPIYDLAGLDALYKVSLQGFGMRNQETR